MNENFAYIWRATFEHKVITQDKNDRYSKHNPRSDYNPSSFRDFQDYFDMHPNELVKFELIGKENVFTLDLKDKKKPVMYIDRYGRYGSRSHTMINREKRELHDIRVIYYRKCECEVRNGKMGFPRVVAYVLGYQGLDDNGNNRQKQVTVI